MLGNHPSVVGRPDRLVLVVGTGTGVGKTWVSARLLGALRARGHRVAARKPAQSYDPADEPDPNDAEILAAVTNERPQAVCPPERWYPMPFAPPMAADALGLPAFTVADLVSETEWPPDTTVGLVETVGGVRSPLAADGDSRAFVQALGPDLVILVAEGGLGAINAVRLSVDALEGICTQPTQSPGAARGPELPTLALVLNRFDPAQDLHRRNLSWLRSVDHLDVISLPGDESGLCARVLEHGSSF